MNTAIFRCADIHCTSNPVIAVYVGGIDAPNGQIAGVQGARVVITTIHGGAGFTRSIQTRVPGCAGVPIFAKSCIGGIYTSIGPLTGVIGAGIFIIAPFHGPPYTKALCAQVTHGAGISVITAPGIGRIRAASGGITGICSAHIPVITIDG